LQFAAGQERRIFPPMNPLVPWIRFCALAAALALAGGVHAQNQPTPTADRLDVLKQRDQEMETLREQQKKSAESEAELKREIEKIGVDRRKLNQDLIDTAARIRDLERKIGDTEQRLKPLDADEARVRKSLDGRRATIAEVLAAMQRMGLHPPPALMVSPEDALQSVRSAMLLGSVLPQMRGEMQKLANDLGELVRVRKEIATERDNLKSQAAAIEADRTRMAALVGERQKQQADREASLAAERARAVDLAKQADNLQDLITKLEAGLDKKARDARLAARPDASGTSPGRDPGRLAPEVNFASLKGRIQLPVNGVKIRDFGAPDSAGSTERGLSIATRAGAQVTAPADAWVVYAGPFRSYGQLLILNMGGGYHLLLAGMERISVDLGQFVLAGEPVAVMGNGSRIAAVLATGSSQPVLYIEFRKDGTPIDPGPWWAAGEVKKVRG
jgi:septal ring factor EnvC (AmiA/AmiB activator)